MQEEKIKSTKEELRNVQKQIAQLRNKEYSLNKEYVEELKRKCKKNIGRCFKKIKDGQIISYYKVVDIDRASHRMNGKIDFNEYQYPSMFFNYPYKNSKMPFQEESLFSGVWGEGNNILGKLNGLSYVEISKEEFNEKFNEVNSRWIQKMNEV